MKTIHRWAALMVAFTSIFSFKAFSQSAPAIQWQNSIGGGGTELLYQMKPTSDGGFILGGSSSSVISGDKTEGNFGGSYDCWLIRTDSLGNVLWDNTIGGGNVEEIKSVEQTADGGFILGASSASNISPDKSENSIGLYDFWIIKTNAAGVIEHENTIGGFKDDQCNSVHQTADGGYIVAGVSRSSTSGDKTEDSIGVQDFWVLKLDTALNIQWQNTIGGSGYEFNCTIIETSDGNYLLAGSSTSGISGDKTEPNLGAMDYWILKLDTAGTILWQNTIGGSLSDYLYSVVETPDKGFILGGYSVSPVSADKTEPNYGSYDCWLVKTDSAGTVLWQNTIGCSAADYLFEAQPTLDGGYILGGYSASDSCFDKTENHLGNDDYWILKTDSTGNVQWDNTIGGNAVDRAFSVCQTPDAGYVICGHSSSPASGDKAENGNGVYDYWLVKLIPETPTSVNQVITDKIPMAVYPNPNNGLFTLQLQWLQTTSCTVRLYDIFGKVCFEQQQQLAAGINKVAINHALSSGIYLLEVVSANERKQVKVMVGR